MDHAHGRAEAVRELRPAPRCGRLEPASIGRISRREALCWLGASALAALGPGLGRLPRAVAAGPAGAVRGGTGDMLSGAACHADVVRYCGFGHHRTGSEPERQTAAWLMEQLAEAGLAPREQAITCRQFDLQGHGLEVDGAPVDAFPLWEPVATPADGVRGPLWWVGSVDGDRSRRDRSGGDRRSRREQREADRADGAGGSDGAIAVLVAESLRDVRRSVAERLTALHRAGVAGAIVICRTRSGDLLGEKSTSALAVPTMLVGGRDEARLRAAAERSAPGRLIIRGRWRTRMPASNVFAEIEPATRTPDRRRRRCVVISTPFSAWFTAGGERGPGVALWLALARWAAARRDLGLGYRFVATTGHELDGAGIRAFMPEHAPDPNDTVAWLHLGASIAVYEWAPAPNGDGLDRLDEPARRGRALLTNTRWLQEVLADAFADQPAHQPRLTRRAIGELQLFYETGYTAAGFVGANAHFHTPADGPRSTGPELLEPVAHALAGVLRELETRA